MMPFMPNLQSIAIKKYLFEVLKERYGRNDKFIERLSVIIATKEDFDNFGKMVADLYESGFMRAVDQYKEQFEKSGMKVNIVAEEKPKDPNHRIFGHSEKSG